MEDKNQFLQLFLKSQGELLSFILSMGIAPHCAEDVLQEAALVMFKKFDEFEEGTNFRAWAFTIVRYQIMRLRKWQAKQSIRLSEEAMDRFEARALEADQARIPFEALAHCLERLSDKAREIVSLRYGMGMDVRSIAERLSRPAESLYTTLSRIKRSLQECLQNAERRGTWTDEG